MLGEASYQNVTILTESFTRYWNITQKTFALNNRNFEFPIEEIHIKSKNSKCYSRIGKKYIFKKYYKSLKVEIITVKC